MARQYFRDSLVAFCFLLLGSMPTHSAERGYIKKQSGSKIVIVFVHGLVGDAKWSWTKNGAYWPLLIADDPVFQNADIYVH